MIVESAVVRHETMPEVETPTFPESDIGKSYTMTLDVTFTQIDRSIVGEGGESPERNQYVFVVDNIVSVIED